MDDDMDDDMENTFSLFQKKFRMDDDMENTF